MLAIKLRPVGKKKQISFRIVVAEKKSKLKGKSVEDLGWYNPHTNLFSVNKDRAQYWIKAGACPTDSVHNILVKGKVIEGAKIPKHGKGEQPAAPAQEAAPAAAEPQVSEAPAPEAPAEEMVAQEAPAQTEEESAPQEAA